MRRAVLVLRLAVTAAIAAACSNISGSDVPPNRYAALNVVAQNNGAGATGTATMIFFRGVNVQVPRSSTQQFDQCIISGLDTSVVVSTGMNGVGSGLAMTVGGRSVPMNYNSTLLRYESPSNQPISYTAGESVSITVPDAGTTFPASTLTLKLAEPISPQPLTIPAAGTDWIIRWNGFSADVSSIQLQLRYGTTAGLTGPNEQVYCVFKDDGEAVVPSTLLAPFLASPSNLRSMRILRWRTNERVIDANTLLHLVSAIDTVVRFP